MHTAATRFSGKLLIEKIPGRGYALFIALLPVLMMYQVPAAGIGVSTAMIIAGSFYAAAVIFQNLLEHQGKFCIAKILVPFILYLLYVMAKSAGDTVNMIQTLLIIVHIIAFSTGAVSPEHLKKYIVAISVLACTLTIVQSVFHYTLGVHIPCIAPSLCLDSLQYYKSAILTGYQAVSSLYRPSAFFLEPSHLTQYAFVALLLCLFHGKKQLPAAVCISMGMVATTSGMGIMLAAGIWGLFGLNQIRRASFSGKIVRIMGYALALTAVFLFLCQFAFFRSALERIFSPVQYSQVSYNAIWGRTLYWDAYIAPMSGSQLLFGFGYAQLPEEYFTGLMELIYCSGLLGVVLYYFAMLTTALRCKGVPRITSVLLCGLMLVANTTSLISMTYYIGILLVFGLETGTEPADSLPEVQKRCPAGTCTT